MKTTKVFAIVTVALLAQVALAQPQTNVEVTQGPEHTTVQGLTKMTATVVGIDKATRTVTLKTHQGKVVELEVTNEARNFDQLALGDIVTVSYSEALTLSLMKEKGQASHSEIGTEERACSRRQAGRHARATRDDRRGRGCRGSQDEDGHAQGTQRQYGGFESGGSGASQAPSQGRSGRSRLYRSLGDKRGACGKEMTRRMRAGDDGDSANSTRCSTLSDADGEPLWHSSICTGELARYNFSDTREGRITKIFGARPCGNEVTR